MTATRSTEALEALERRARLLDGVPVRERRITAADVPTAVLEGGEGPPVVLLHGPGESAVNWRWTVPGLVSSHRVVAPDLPAHGSSGVGDRPLDADHAVSWLRAVVDQTCEEPPAVVGHVLGGAVAARLAARHPDRLAQLVLVDSLGLGRFRPKPRFALGFLRFAARPRERSFERFMDQCSLDLDHVRGRVGDAWADFVAYNVASARSESAKDAGRLFRAAGVPRIPTEELARIQAPTALVWGREDRANRVRIAEAASARYGWPLHVIDDAADDPARDQPAAFLRVLRSLLGDGRGAEG